MCAVHAAQFWHMHVFVSPGLLVVHSNLPCHATHAYRVLAPLILSVIDDVPMYHTFYDFDIMVVCLLMLF